jgi:hypothetical protein
MYSNLLFITTKCYFYSFYIVIYRTVIKIYKEVFYRWNLANLATIAEYVLRIIRNLNK